MRLAFTKSLIAHTKVDKNIFLLTGDLGYGVLENFFKEFPHNYLNMGVAEQNMIGVASGLALSGKKPYVFSIATFAIMRCLEQIRNDICYQNLDVSVIGVGGGLTYSLYGATHQAIDDLAITRALPNMIVIAPGDPFETEAAIDFSVTHQGPVYIRLAAKGEPNIHFKKPVFKLGKGFILKEGTDITLLVTGNMLENAFKTTELLLKRNISVRLVSMPFVKPIDEQIILESAKKTKAIFTLEEHNKIGGLGTAVAEVLVESCLAIPFWKIALPDNFPKEIGGRFYLRELFGLSPQKIFESIFTKYMNL